MSVSASVVGEEDIVEGDIVSVSVKLTRTNLKEGEIAGPVHAPFYPKDKNEEWWIFLSDKSSGNTKNINGNSLSHHPEDITYSTIKQF